MLRVYTSWWKMELIRGATIIERLLLLLIIGKLVRIMRWLLIERRGILSRHRYTLREGFRVSQKKKQRRAPACCIEFPDCWILGFPSRILGFGENDFQNPRILAPPPASPSDATDHKEDPQDDALGLRSNKVTDNHKTNPQHIQCTYFSRWIEWCCRRSAISNAHRRIHSDSSCSDFSTVDATT